MQKRISKQIVAMICAPIVMISLVGCSDEHASTPSVSSPDSTAIQNMAEKAVDDR